VSITDRDRKILMLLVPIALALAYWFLLLAPKREEATTVQDQLTQAQSQRDTAEERASTLATAKRNFASDYATVIYLGKSIPANVDMPSLLVQLDRAARGTGISFTSVQTGERTAAAATSTSATPSSGTPAPAPAGTSGAASAPGAAAQGATNAVNGSNSASAAASGSTPATPGAPATDPAAAQQTTLETVPLDFQFDGSFFDLADFFHRMKRFVRVANNDIIVRGRLLTIDSFSFDSADTFPSLKASVHATVYLAPKAQGVSAGASQTGPGGAAPATPAGTQTAQSSSSPTPVAAVTAR
jgi:Tfp pilus assembly protein PilO